MELPPSRATTSVTAYPTQIAARTQPSRRSVLLRRPLSSTKTGPSEPSGALGSGSSSESCRPRPSSWMVTSFGSWVCPVRAPSRQVSTVVRTSPTQDRVRATDRICAAGPGPHPVHVRPLPQCTRAMNVAHAEETPAPRSGVVPHERYIRFRTVVRALPRGGQPWEHGAGVHAGAHAPARRSRPSAARRRGTQKRGPRCRWQRGPRSHGNCGDGGNRTRVQRCGTRASPSAVRYAFLGPGGHTNKPPTGPATV